MKSSNIIPMEIRGYFIDDKVGVFSNLNFQWNVGIIPIKLQSKKQSEGN